MHFYQKQYGTKRLQLNDLRPSNLSLVRYSQYMGPKYCHTSDDFALADADEMRTNKQQIVSVSSALNRLTDPEMKAFFTVRRRSFSSILSNARPTSISSYRITTKKSQILGTGSCRLTLAGVNSVVYGNAKRLHCARHNDVILCIQVSKFF